MFGIIPAQRLQNQQHAGSKSFTAGLNWSTANRRGGRSKRATHPPITSRNPTLRWSTCCQIRADQCANGKVRRDISILWPVLRAQTPGSKRVRGVTQTPLSVFRRSRISSHSIPIRSTNASSMVNKSRRSRVSFTAAGSANMKQVRSREARAADFGDCCING